MIDCFPYFTFIFLLKAILNSSYSYIQHILVSKGTRMSEYLYKTFQPSRPVQTVYIQFAVMWAVMWCRDVDCDCDVNCNVCRDVDCDVIVSWVSSPHFGLIVPYLRICISFGCRKNSVTSFYNLCWTFKHVATRRRCKFTFNSGWFWKENTSEIYRFSTCIKVNKLTQELIQSDPTKVLNIKGKDMHMQLNSLKKNR